METYVKKFTRKLLEHKDKLNEYVDQLYVNDSEDGDLNELFGLLKQEGLLSFIYADNRACNVHFTLKGKNLPASALKLSDKEELLMLINSIHDIEQLFHKNSDIYGSIEEIHDVPRYQEWIQQIIMYLQEIYDRTNDQFIYGTIDSCQRPLKGINDRRQFNEIKGKLKSIERNIDKYYQQDDGNGIMQDKKKTPMIFISHSSNDKPHVDLIVKLLKEMGFKQDKVFCSTIPGYGIGLSKDIYDTLLSLFSEHDLYVIFVHSPKYYDSAVGLNEMGAAWALKSNYCSILLPGFDYSEMKGVVDSRKITIKIDGDRRTVQNLINDLYDDLARFFSTTRDTSIVWEDARDEFIDKMNAFHVTTESQLTKEAESVLKEAGKDKRGIVTVISDITGVTIQAGNTSMNNPGIRRDEVRMEAAIKELIKAGLLEHTGKDTYQITDSGYNYLDGLEA